MADKDLLELDKQELMTLWRDGCQRGAEHLTAAQKIVRNYASQEKMRGGRLTESAKTGIYAYHYDYANQAIIRLEKLSPKQKTLGNELNGIQVSTEFVQSLAPEMSEWERLHYFQYGTEIHDLSGEPVETVKMAISSIYLTAWTGLLHQKFKEQASLFERLFAAPMIMPQVGPLMVYRKWMRKGLHYYYFNPENVATRERE